MGIFKERESSPYIKKQNFSGMPPCYSRGYFDKYLIYDYDLSS